MRPAYHKTIFRVDYRPALAFYDRLYSVAASMGGYPDWWTDGHSVTLQNFEDHCSFRLGYNSAVYAQDMKGSPNEDNVRIREAIVSLVSIPKDGRYQRVGLRRIYLSPTQMEFGDLVSLVADKFLRQDPEIEDGICPSPTDVSYVVVFSEASAKVNLAVGPTRRDELESALQPDMNNFSPKERGVSVKDLYQSYPEVSLLIGIDCATEDVSPERLVGVYEDAVSLHEKLVQNVVHYVFGL